MSLRLWQGLIFATLTFTAAVSVGGQVVHDLPEASYRGWSSLKPDRNFYDNAVNGDVMALVVQKDPGRSQSYYALLMEYKRVPGTQYLGPRYSLTNWIRRIYAYHMVKVNDLEYELLPLRVTSEYEITADFAKTPARMTLEQAGSLDRATISRDAADGRQLEAVTIVGSIGSTWEGYIPGKYFRATDTTGGEYNQKGVNTWLTRDGLATFMFDGVQGYYNVHESRKAPRMFTFSANSQYNVGDDKILGRIGVFIDIVNWKHLGIDRFTTEELLIVNPENASDIHFFYERHGEEAKDEIWSAWDEKNELGGLFTFKHVRDNLLFSNLHDGHVNYEGYGRKDCSTINMSYRSADGSCYIAGKPFVGAAGTAFGRNLPPKFIDQAANERLMSPNPALVSKVFFTRDEFKAVPFLNMLAASWIQFMNHDWLTHGPNEDANPYRVRDESGAERVVERTQINRNDSSMYRAEYGQTTINDVTHWWDGSQVYGSSADELNSLREFRDGLLKMSMVNGQMLLPRDAALNVTDNKQNRGYEMTGFRDNWWVGLSMLHTLFAREHNAIAKKLMEEHVTKKRDGTYTWRNGRDRRDGLSEREIDGIVFHTARLINAAVMAKIHTVEWTPAILPHPTLKVGMCANWYGRANPSCWTTAARHLPNVQVADWFRHLDLGYAIGGIVGSETRDYGVPYSITEEFTSVYRLHSLLPENIEVRRLSRGKKNEVISVPFADTRNEKSYGVMMGYGMKDLFYSFGTQNPGQLVLNNFPKFMQDMTIPGRPNMDLGMVDILRDRERGVPRYNQFRRAIQLNPIEKYSDFFPGGVARDARQQAILQKFYDVYGKDAMGRDNVEEIDLLVGTLAEEVRPANFGFGETMFQIFILMASRRLMADPYFTEKYTAEYYTQTGLNWIDREGSFAKVIKRHMPDLAPHVEGIETAFNPWKR